MVKLQKRSTLLLWWGRKEITYFTIFIMGILIGVSLTSPARLSKQFDANEDDPNLNIDVFERSRKFIDYAVSLRPVTDKVYTHSYHTMYGQFLMPFVGAKPDLKMFEIGLGCAMDYGAGASVGVWKKLFPHIELWEADVNEECVNKWKDKDSMKGINLLVGDQNNPETLDSWIEKSGGKFDVIIDDGGHEQCQINTSFTKLWPELNPGGLYFVEDLQVGNLPQYTNKLNDVCDNTSVSEIIKEWMDQLLYSFEKDSKEYKYKLPEGMISVYCQEEACVFQKKKDEIHDKVPFLEEFNDQK